MKLTALRCILNRHRPDRETVVSDWLDFSGECIDCGAPIRRVSHNDWRYYRSVGSQNKVQGKG